jgi:hypothetical protein
MAFGQTVFGQIVFRSIDLSVKIFGEMIFRYNDPEPTEPFLNDAEASNQS